MEPIHASILSDDVKVIEYFIQKFQYDINHMPLLEIFDRKVLKGLTSLMIAIEVNSEKIFQYILKTGANLDITDDKGRTALHWTLELSKAF